MLGPLNLSRFVSEPFTPDARLVTDALAKIVPVAVGMLDNAIDVSRFPLEDQRREAEAKSLIGLGVTGLADALAMCGANCGDATFAVGGPVIYMTHTLEQAETLEGRTYKIIRPDSDHPIYSIVKDVIEDGRRRPFEVFINPKNTKHYAWSVVLTLIISAIFRHGGDVSFSVEELKAVFDPHDGQWIQGKYDPPLLTAIGEQLERHMIHTGFLKREADASTANPASFRKSAPLWRCQSPPLRRV